MLSLFHEFVHFNLCYYNWKKRHISVHKVNRYLIDKMQLRRVLFLLWICCMGVTESRVIHVRRRKISTKLLCPDYVSIPWHLLSILQEFVCFYFFSYERTNIATVHKVMRYLSTECRFWPFLLFCQWIMNLIYDRCCTRVLRDQNLTITSFNAFFHSLPDFCKGKSTHCDDHRILFSEGCGKL